MGFRSPILQAEGEVAASIEYLNRAIDAIERGYAGEHDQLPEPRRRLRERIVVERTRIADLARELHVNGIDALKGV